MDEKETRVGFADLFFENLTMPNGMQLSYDKEDYLEGEEYYGTVMAYLNTPLATAKFRKKDEAEAYEAFCKVLKEINNPKIPKFLALDNQADTEYSIELDTIILSKQISKYYILLRDSNLYQVLLMNLIRGISLRTVYREFGYEQLFMYYAKEANTMSHDGDSINISVDVTEREWNYLAKVEFIRELFAWSHALDLIAKDELFEDHNLGLSKRDFNRLKKYHLYLLITTLYDAKTKDRCLTLFDGAMSFNF